MTCEEGSEMYARTSTWAGTAETLERWATVVGERVAPMVAGLPGNAGAYFLIDRGGGSALSLTLWESEDAARASDDSAEQSGASTIAATGVRLVRRGLFEVVGRGEQFEASK